MMVKELVKYIENNEEIFNYFFTKQNLDIQTDSIIEKVLHYFKNKNIEATPKNIQEIFDNKGTNEIDNYINREENRKGGLRGHMGSSGWSYVNETLCLNGLFIDDIRTPIQESVYKIPSISKNLNIKIKWQICRSYEDFLGYILLNGFCYVDIISLDHDLTIEAMENYFRTNGDIDYTHNTKTGNDVAKFINNNKDMFAYTWISFHSNNKKGVINMGNTLKAYSKIISKERFKYDYSEDYKNMPNYLAYLELKQKYKSKNGNR
jgi:hypothetical protein